MFRATGIGTIRPDSRVHSSGSLAWIHLDNFDVDGTTLKIEHRNELDRRFGHNFLPTTHTGDLLIPADDIWIFLRGYASRTGGRDHVEDNMALSLERVAVVSNYLNRIGISDGHITGLDYVGEAWSHGEIEEDDEFRSVEVIARSENSPPPPARPAFIYDRFRMRAKPIGGEAVDAISQGLDAAGHALPAGLGATFLRIQIERLRTHERKNYLFYTAQVSAGLSVPSFMFLQPGAFGEGGDGYGDWVRFRTRSHDHHVAFTEFEGSANFGNVGSVQFGTLDAGDSFFEFRSELMHSIEHWVNIRPRTIVLPMPTSNGLSFSLVSLSMGGSLVLLD